MEGLRLILLVVGALVVAGVYMYSRWGSAPRRGRGQDDESDFSRDAPYVDIRNGDDGDELPDDLPSLRADDDAELDEDPERTPPRSAGKPDVREKIIVLNILPLETGMTFPGADLLDIFDRTGLEYGQYGVFHRIKEMPDGPKIVFSVASATEPGSFDITNMADESFRGLSLFMLLPGPLRGVDAFADMLATARRIAEQIRGEVKDRDRSTLTRQTAHHVREEIIAFEHRLHAENRVS